EAPLTGVEPGDGFIQGRLAEVGPQDVAEIELGVREVPQQEVADAAFAACADEEIRVRDAGERQGRGETRLIHLLRLEAARGHVAGETARGGDDVPTAAVTHGDIEQHARVAGGERFGFRHAGTQLVRER